MTFAETVQRHAAAVVAGDSAVIAGDFSPAGMARALLLTDEPRDRPLSFEITQRGDGLADITYFGEGTRTMSTTWRETRPGTWQMIDIVERSN